MIWRRALAVNMTYYYLWAAFSPIVLWAAKRYRMEGGAWRHNALVHVLVSCVLTVALILIAESLLTLVGPKIRGTNDPILYGLQRNFHSSLPTYWLILFVYYTFDYYAKYRDRELRAAQLAERLSQSQLQALKMQLNPHFLFNTLNSISSLMYTNLEAADAMITRLGDLLRSTLENEGAQEIPLRQELDFLERYLEIERIRFEERLIVKMDIDADTLDAQVPNLALQPLVENAIHHGIARLPQGGTIELSAHRENGMLRIGVRNDLPSTRETKSPREGIGLANTRARLEQLYGRSHSFEWNQSVEGSLLVSLSIPFRTA